jgi:hypothetical protein
VYIPNVTVQGVPKETASYVDSVLRWNTGAVELFWQRTIWSFSCFYAPFCTFLTFFTACFVKSIYSVIPWLAILGFVMVGLAFDKRFGRKPLRVIAVAAIVFQNTTYFWAATLSPVYTILLPLSLAMGRQPFGNSTTGIFFWALIAIAIKLPQIVMNDTLCFMARRASPDWLNTTSYALVFWRGTQLYLGSWLMTLRTIVEGFTRSVSGAFYEVDLTAWNPNASVKIKALSANSLLSGWSTLVLVLNMACLVCAVVAHANNSAILLSAALACLTNIVAVKNFVVMAFDAERSGKYGAFMVRLDHVLTCFGAGVFVMCLASNSTVRRTISDAFEL